MSSIIEVGIGLILVYVVLSLLVSQINNITKNVLNIRADMVYKELQDLLTDPVIRDKVLSHPSVQLLTNTNEGSVAKSVPPEMLVDVLVDVLAEDSETLEMLENLTNTPLVDQLVNSISDPAMEQKVRTVLATARHLKDAKSKLTNWIDSSLSRAKEVYKKRMQLLSFVSGALLCLLLNVDSLHLAESFWNDPVLRQTTVEAASTFADQVDIENAAEDPENLEDSIAAAQATLNQLEALRLPIGWHYTDLSPLDPAIVNVREPFEDNRNIWNLIPGNNENWLAMLLIKLGGLTISALAVMQGAPFWFDLLRRLTGKG